MKKIMLFIALLFIPFITCCNEHKCENLSYRVIKEATCSESGIEELYCLDCNKSLGSTREIKKLNTQHLIGF